MVLYGCPTKLSFIFFLYNTWANIEQTSTPYPDPTSQRYLYSVWYAAHKHVGDTPTLSQFTPVWGNEQFTPGKRDGGFQSWNTKGIQKMMDLYTDGVLLSFDQL